MQRLATLVPRPRLKLIRFHGVLAPNARLRSKIVPGGPVNANQTADDLEGAALPAPSVRMSWPRLLERIFDIDIEHCPHCGGTMKIIAAIEQPAVITKILDHLGLSILSKRSDSTPTRRFYAVLLTNRQSRLARVRLAP
jgi:hypothetical protein